MHSLVLSLRAMKYVLDISTVLFYYNTEPAIFLPQ